MAAAYYAVSDSRRSPRQRVGSAARSSLSRPSPRAPVNPRTDPRTPLRPPTGPSVRPPVRSPNPRYMPPAKPQVAPPAPLGTPPSPKRGASSALGRALGSAARLPTSPYAAAIAGATAATAAAVALWEYLDDKPAPQTGTIQVANNGWTYTHCVGVGLLGWRNQLSDLCGFQDRWFGHTFRNEYVPNYGQPHPNPNNVRKGWKQMREIAHYPNGSWIHDDGGWIYDPATVDPSKPPAYDKPPFYEVPASSPLPVRTPAPAIRPDVFPRPAPYPLIQPVPNPVPRPNRRPIEEVVVVVRPHPNPSVVVRPNPRGVGVGRAAYKKGNPRNGTREQKRLGGRAAQALWFAWEMSQDIPDFVEILYKANGGEEGRSFFEQINWLSKKSTWDNFSLAELIKATIEYWAEENFYGFLGKHSDRVNQSLGSPLNMRELYYHWDNADPVGSFFGYLEKYGW